MREVESRARGVPSGDGGVANVGGLAETGGECVLLSEPLYRDLLILLEFLVSLLVFHCGFVSVHAAATTFLSVWFLGVYLRSP